MVFQANCDILYIRHFEMPDAKSWNFAALNVLYSSQVMFIFWSKVKGRLILFKSMYHGVTIYI